jgi:hypothetical protein
MKLRGDSIITKELIGNAERANNAKNNKYSKTVACANFNPIKDTTWKE